MAEKGFGRANKPSENIMSMIQQADLQTEEHKKKMDAAVIQRMGNATGINYKAS
jgi:hypothetical protein